jgi:hypothetical protein
MDNMYSLPGLEVAREINRDRLAEAEVRRNARLVYPTLFARLSRRARNWAPPTVVKVRPTRAATSSGPMGCTA